MSSVLIRKIATACAALAVVAGAVTVASGAEARSATEAAGPAAGGCNFPTVQPQRA